MSGTARRSGGTAGTSVIEVLVGAAITLAVTTAALGQLIQVQAAFDGRMGAADLEQRVRAAVATLERDLLAAGAGRSVGIGAGPLGQYLPPVAPYRRGQITAGEVAGASVLSLLFAPAGAAEARVRDVTAAGGMLVVEVEPNCGPAWHDRLCGFVLGTRALVVGSSGAFALGTVSLVDGARVVLEVPGVTPAGFGGGALLVEVVAPTYSLGEDPESGAPRLMHYDGFRTSRPVVDHVVAFDVEAFADPEPPRLIPQVDEGGDPIPPRTTYGPGPPPADVDDPADTWGPGENCLFVRVDGTPVPRLPRLAAGAGLVPLDRARWEDGPWCADAAGPSRYDADLLRIRRVRVRLRLEAAPDALRGPSSWLFARSGRSTSAARLVPDREVSLDVSPRNLNLGR